MTRREPFSFYRQHSRCLNFCIYYLFGLILGALYITQYPFYSLMPLLVYPQMSIVLGFVISALPFIVFYISLRCSAFWCIYILAFLKAFIFMYCFGSISLAYADAGWLVRFILLFSDFFLAPLLVWYTVNVLLFDQRKNDRYIWVCLVCVLAIRCLDSYVISPFALKLLLF